MNDMTKFNTWRNYNHTRHVISITISTTFNSCPKLPCNYDLKNIIYKFHCSSISCLVLAITISDASRDNSSASIRHIILYVIFICSLKCRPCGVDLPDGFAGGRTGRFTNGYSLADIVAQDVGFNMSPPAYLSLTPQTSLDLLRGRVGANYATGGSGILDFTGNGTISLREQVQLFADTKARMIIAGEVSRERLDHLLSRSLFVACTGGNDFAAFSDGRVDIGDAPAYIAGMVAAYVERIRALYDLGARRVGVLDVLPLGCVPSVRASYGGGGACDGVGNSLARRFNALLRRDMAAAAAASMPGMAYSVGSLFNAFSDIIADPRAAGLEEAASACCGGGRLNAEEECSARSNLCADRGGHVFWDKVHGTEAAYRRAVAAVFHGRTARYAEPVSFERLIGEPAAYYYSSM